MATIFETIYETFKFGSRLRNFHSDALFCLDYPKINLCIAKPNRVRIIFNRHASADVHLTVLIDRCISGPQSPIEGKSFASRWANITRLRVAQSRSMSRVKLLTRRVRIDFQVFQVICDF